MKLAAVVLSATIAATTLTGCNTVQTDAAQGVGAKTCEVLTAVEGSVKDFTSSAGETTVGDLKAKAAEIDAKLAEAKKDSSGLAAALINSVQAVFSGATSKLKSEPDDKKVSELGAGFQSVQQNFGKIYDEAMSKLKCA